MTFSEKLKQVMRELHLNQRQVCGMTGKSKGSVSQYLSGKQIPSENVQRDIAVSLGLDQDYFTKDNSQTVVLPTKEVRNGVIPRLDVEKAAKLLQMNHNTVRKGLQQGVFPWGYAIKTSENRWCYFINAKRFAEIEGCCNMNRSDELEHWAKAQKRVTNKHIRNRFDVDEEQADEYYQYLKQIGIVGRMGMVIKESEDFKNE